MKKLAAFVLTCTMILGAATVSHAAGWIQGKDRKDDKRYVTENGSFLAGWQVLDEDGDGTGYWYYFDPAGWLKTNCETPDGYTVNEDGVWVDEGEIVTVDMSGVEPWQNDINDMPAGDYYFSYMLYNYGDKVGVLDKTTQSAVVLESHDKKVITMMFRVERNDGSAIMYPMEFERQKNGTYAYTEDSSTTTLTWDVHSRNFTTDDEERYCVYDLAGSKPSAEE